ncbi:hypothetical protein H9P43_006178 [Blastocladiella emersonii ATCC 22665]|nr:hypothetical protein H9P43_006178 [Blastocladiella emersonii ATCC 22665]
MAMHRGTAEQRLQQQQQPQRGEQWNHDRLVQFLERHLPGDDGESREEAVARCHVAWCMLWQQSNSQWTTGICALFDLAALSNDPPRGLAASTRFGSELVLHLAGAAVTSKQAASVWSHPAWSERIGARPDLGLAAFHAYLERQFNLADAMAGEDKLGSLLALAPRWLQRRARLAQGGSLLAPDPTSVLTNAARLLGARVLDARTLARWVLDAPRPLSVFAVIHVLAESGHALRTALESAVNSILVDAVKQRDLTRFAVGLALVRSFLAPTPPAYDAWLAGVIHRNSLGIFPLPSSAASSTTTDTTAPDVAPIRLLAATADSAPTVAPSIVWFELLGDLVPLDDATALAAHLRATTAAAPLAITPALAAAPWRVAGSVYHRQLVARLGEFGGDDAHKDAVGIVRAVLGPPPNTSGKPAKGTKAAALAVAAAAASKGDKLHEVPRTLFNWCLVKQKWVHSRLLPALWGLLASGQPGNDLDAYQPAAVRRAVSHIMDTLKKARRLPNDTWLAWTRVRDDPSEAAFAAAATTAGSSVTSGGSSAAAGGMPGTTPSTTQTQAAGVPPTLLLSVHDRGVVRLRVCGPKPLPPTMWPHLGNTAERLLHVVAYTLEEVLCPATSAIAPTGDNLAILAEMVARELTTIDPSAWIPLPITVACAQLPPPWSALARSSPVLVAASPVDALLLPWLLSPARFSAKTESPWDRFAVALMDSVAGLTNAAILATQAPPLRSFFTPAADGVQPGNLSASAPATAEDLWSIEALHKLWVRAATLDLVAEPAAANVARILATRFVSSPAAWAVHWIPLDGDAAALRVDGNVPRLVRAAMVKGVPIAAVVAVVRLVVRDAKARARARGTEADWEALESDARRSLVPVPQQSLPDTAPGSAAVAVPTIDGFLIAALFSPVDRELVLELQDMIEEFLRAPDRTRLDLPPANAYRRLIAHRVAEYFGLDHVVVTSNSNASAYGHKRVVMYKSLASFIPGLRLEDLIPKFDPVFPPPPAQNGSTLVAVWCWDPSLNAFQVYMAPAETLNPNPHPREKPGVSHALANAPPSPAHILKVVPANPETPLLSQSDLEMTWPGTRARVVRFAPPVDAADASADTELLLVFARADHAAVAMQTNVSTEYALVPWDVRVTPAREGVRPLTP